MAKKKVRNVPAQESPDAGPTCKHFRKALEEGAVKKALVNVEYTVCQDCPTDGRDKNGEEEEREEGASIWLCLTCGHRGCGRNSEHQHALNHYNTPRSVPHCLVLSCDMWSVWCYICDDEVPYTNTNRLGQLVEYIQKKSKANTKSRNSERGVETPEKVSEQNNRRTSDEEDPGTLAEGVKASNTPSNNKETAVKGLSNLGNTCFFNAVMQNLSQTPVLREFLNEVKIPRKSVAIELPDSSCEEVIVEQLPGPLTLAMCQFLTEMQETKKGVVTPKELFSQVCKKAIRFKGYQQQDSQELLRYLLDGMRGEEIQRISVAMTKALHDSTDEEEIKKKIKDCEKRRAIPNFVDRLFGGELTSTIVCEQCRTVSLVHEPFLDLSLPVLDDLRVKKNSKIAKNICDQNVDEDNDKYVKEKSDESGPSKHLQKKAKKQAKKQAKNQRRLQKIQDKTVVFSDLNSEQNDDSGDEDAASNDPMESEVNSKLDDGSAPKQLPSEKTNVDRAEGDAASDTQNPENVTNSSLEDTQTDVEKLENYIGLDKKDFEENTKSVIVDGEKSMEDGAANVYSEGTESLRNNVVLENDDDDDDHVNADNTELPAGTSCTLFTGDTSAPKTERFTPEDQLTETLNQLNLDADLGPEQIEVEIIDKQPAAQVYEVVNEDPKTAFSTLSERKSLPLDECSVLSCLYQFTSKEDLTGNNQLLCNECTRRQLNRQKNNSKGEKKFVYTNAKKQMLVSVPPPILTLHLKRFQQNGFNLHKINKHIKFPELIDLGPFCTVKCKNIPEGESRLLYSLYGVIEHSGTMRSGHYTAYVKSRNRNAPLCDLVLRGAFPEESSAEPPRGHWYHISDSHVQAVPLSKVLSSQAYLLFYERIL
ncbi:ubiquitin carboxyl-terminal hydrolase 16 [Spea bombifrons]|uniref:ubiquitin carboxyl-terminal hydrolase 16 n=1 Tax=Spea bombifrons TaxID=233779 RepID=UPI0023496576|nr:ubiquitin carboxyl-terminal hydrolase 16 [Spea bombifrons]